MAEILTPKNLIIKIIIGLIILTAVMGLCSLVGTQKISLEKVFAGPGQEPSENIDYKIFIGVRVPRVILAALVGAALACSGVILQAILRNPLADPYILGISSGAALGVIVAVLSGIGSLMDLLFRLLGPWELIRFYDIFFALIIFGLIYCIARLCGLRVVTSLLLVGLGWVVVIIVWHFGLTLLFVFAGSPVALFAFIGALATVWLVWFIGRFAGKSQVTTLLLAGVVVNAFFSAVIMFLISIAKSDQVYSTVFWLMGNITEKDFSVLLVSAVCISGGIIALLTISYRLNVLSFGEEEAKGLGVHTAKTKMLAFGLAAFITAIAVSLSGLIGFVGLIIPHGVRLVFGPDHRQLLPVSAIIGAAFLVIADTIARIIVAPAQLPVGVITAIAGGPFFLVLLAKYTRKVSWLK